MFYTLFPRFKFLVLTKILGTGLYACGSRLATRYVFFKNPFVSEPRRFNMYLRPSVCIIRCVYLSTRIYGIRFRSQFLADLFYQLINYQDKIVIIFKMIVKIVKIVITIFHPIMTDVSHSTLTRGQVI